MALMSKSLILVSMFLMIRQMGKMQKAALHPTTKIICGGWDAPMQSGISYKQPACAPLDLENASAVGTFHIQ